MSRGRASRPTPARRRLLLIYTSGADDDFGPKGVLLRHQKLVSYVLGTVEFAAAEEELRRAD